MPGWEEGSGFRVVGFVVRKYVADSGKFARVTVDVNQSPHPAKLDFRTFDPTMVADVGALKAGQKVQVRGRIESEKLKDKNKVEIMKDGYVYWATVLTLTSVEVEGSSRSPAAPAPAAEPGAAAPDPFAAPAGLPGGGDPFAGGGDNPFGR